jgi:CDP-diacylglycerol--glycerol-3-phosphate 3-phosphatidyltransferase
MTAVWNWIRRGYLQLMDPFADWLVRLGVRPNTITTFGTLCTVVTGVFFGLGWIRSAGWFLSVTAVFDVVDGTVARRSGQSTRFGAFYDSTLDRVADGVMLGGLVVFYATSPTYANPLLLVITLLGLIGTFLTSYARARAESLGIDAHVGLLQRPERVTLLAAPQALFGLAWHGRILAAVVVVLAVTAWITVWQRVRYVARLADADHSPT